MVTPELIAACGAVVVATVTAGPAYLAARKSGRTAQTEGTQTREVLAALGERIDAADRARQHDRTEAREDLRHLREDVRDIRAWQAGHDAEHIALRGLGGTEK